MSKHDHRTLKRIHFNPTIIVHEFAEQDHGASKSSKWFSEHELREFLNETMNVCRSSSENAIKSYSFSEVKKVYDAAHQMGIKSPILSSTTCCHRALFAEEVLQATDEDVVVHDGSFKFFQLMKEEMQRVLIVDNSASSRKLLRRHIMSMFPHVHIDVAMSGEDAMDKIDVCYERACINYDLLIVEERLYRSNGAEDEDVASTSLDFTGSELLRILNEMEASAFGRLERKCASSSKNCPGRKSLKIGVSVSLGEDCKSLNNIGGADLFWSKPPPKPSNGLRNQVLNALLGKRGSSVLICSC